MAELSDADVFGSSPPAATSVPGEMSDADVFGAPQKLSVAESAVAPITDIPSTYSRMVNESVAQMGRGASQLASGDPWSMVKGAGNVALGGLGYAFSPISAPLHTIVGEPVEHATGSPLAGSLAEAGAGFALPVPKGLPRMGRAAELPAESEFGVTLSGGEAANDLAMRQKEQTAIRNAAPGTEAWAAQRQSQIENAKQGLVQGLDPYGQTLAETPTEAGELASQAIRNAAASSKSTVKGLYDQAKSLGGVLDADVFREMPEGIKTDLAGAQEPVIVDPATTPNAAKMLQYIQGKVGNVQVPNLADPNVASKAPIVSADLTTVDQWRKALSAMRRDAAANPGDARAARGVLDAFDDRIDQAVNSNRFDGDPAAVNAWNNARAAYSDYRSTFTAGRNDPVGRVVQKIVGDKVNDPMTPTKVVDQIVGSSGVSPSSLNIGVANRVKSILGEQSPEWIAVKQGVLQRLVSAGEGETALGTGQQAQRLSKFLNSDMAGALYSPQEQATLRSYANLMRRITMPTGSYFPSAPPIQQAMAAMRARVGGIVGALIGHTLVPIPLVGELGGLAAGSQTERALERLHSGVSKQLPIVGDQMAKWSRAQSAAMAQPTNPLLRQGAVGATVNLQKALTPLGIDMKQLAGSQAPGTAGAQPNQQNVPGPIKQEQNGGRIDQQRATGGKVGGESGHKGQIESKKAPLARRADGGSAESAKGMDTSDFRPSTNIEDVRNKPMWQKGIESITRLPIESMAHPFSSAWPNEQQQQMQTNFERNQAWTKPDASNFNTNLGSNQESAFRKWVMDNNVPFDPSAKGPQDYDMRGFYKALQSGDPKAVSAIDPNDSQLHYPDYWKTPYHQTFSNESQWADPKTAPAWNDKDQLVTPSGNVLYDDRRAADLSQFGLPNTADALSKLPPAQSQPIQDDRAPIGFGLAKGGRVKATKTQAHYRGGTANKRCGLCDMFRPPSGCVSVRGIISPQALCDFYEPKKEEKKGAVKIDTTHDGPWMSCMSIDGATMYRNKNIPATANIKGKTVDVDDMLLHHEVPEREDLEKLIKEFKARFKREPNKNERKAIYLKAHNRSGTPNERAHAKKIGVDWKAWSAWCRGEEAKIEKMKFTNQPKDADVKPIPHSHGDLEAWTIRWRKSQAI